MCKNICSFMKFTHCFTRHGGAGPTAGTILHARYRVGPAGQEAACMHHVGVCALLHACMCSALACSVARGRPAGLRSAAWPARETDRCGTTRRPSVPCLSATQNNCSHIFKTAVYVYFHKPFKILYIII